MANVRLNLKNSKISEKAIMEYSDEIKKIHNELHESTSSKKEPLGWLKKPGEIDKKELEKIKKCAEKIRENSSVLLVIGIGGSYLGARAIIESLTNTFYNIQNNRERNGPQILYVGNNLSSNYINDIIELVMDKDISINVISKSGTTTEPAIAFTVFRDLLENKYGISEARKRIYITTDKKRGALKQIADNEGYETFIIPDDIGGRYSVLTPVGLLPISVAGIDIDKLINGARFAQDKYSDDNLKYNDCYKYAVARNILNKKGKDIEILATYEPKMHYIIEWWKQLFAESEGKDKKGIFPVGAEFTKDLHSLGQYIQDGKRNIFETVLNIEQNNFDMVVYFEDDNLDDLSYLSGKKISDINYKAMEATIKAHVKGGVPNIVINLEKLDAETIGHLIYFFQKSCVVSSKILGVNPFDQPGVDEYKNEMFKLLGK